MMQSDTKPCIEIYSFYRYRFLFSIPDCTSGTCINYSLVIFSTSSYRREISRLKIPSLICFHLSVCQVFIRDRTLAKIPHKFSVGQLIQHRRIWTSITPWSMRKRVKNSPLNLIWMMLLGDTVGVRRIICYLFVTFCTYFHNSIRL